ncbi:MarR family transcriptional regulator [Polaromonas sp. YR568]|uniref:MarR family winged helix-turn-helix transcriptional regulator n=1 Tax=Polaromonas sp. YR568 TaxID=1855301 RepID=UPI0031382ADA
MTHDTQNILHHWREAVPNDRLAHLIRDAARAFHRALQVRLAQHGVPFGHWTFLRILWESDGLTQKELSERAGVMEPTTFSAMKAMEALGYIERRQLPTNKKNMYVHLTAQGRALKKLLVPLAEETNNVSIEGISGDELKTTRRVLLAMIENLAKDELLQTPTASARKPSTKPLARAAMAYRSTVTADSKRDKKSAA